MATNNAAIDAIAAADAALSGTKLPSYSELVEALRLAELAEIYWRDGARVTALQKLREAVSVYERIPEEDYFTPDNHHGHGWPN